MTARAVRPTSDQSAALAELTTIAEGDETPLIRAARLDGAETFDIEIELRTDGLDLAEGGLDVSSERETFTLHLLPSFPWTAPQVSVDHDRFVGFPHVLQGRRICVFLDEDQEWRPGMGVVGFLDELHRWLRDAAGGRFDVATALFHPVGGVDHRSPGCPTIVVRDELTFDAGPIRLLWLRPRSEHRLDLIEDQEEGAFPIAAVHLQAPLSYGAGMTVGYLLGAIHRLGFPPVQGLLTALGAAGSRSPAGSLVYFLLAVAPVGDRPDLPRHLVAGRIPREVAEMLRQGMSERSEIQVGDPVLEAPIEWCDVSEERAAVTTRRDARRPTRHLVGASAVVLGCGGVGSWIAEFLARAGAARLFLCDRTTPIHRGLLVRQDFVEQDVGRSKAEAVASRVRAIRDDLEVDVIESVFDPHDGGLSLFEADVLIDATVSRSVSDFVELAWGSSSQAMTVARVCVDRPSSSLGLLTVSRPTGMSLASIDQRARDEVGATPELEAFRVFWDPPASSDEVLAEPGCSVPTFHGSAADLAAMAGVFVSLIAPHLDTELFGCHLVALPHAGARSRSHHWMAASPPEA